MRPTPYLYFCDLFFFFNDTATTEIYTLSLHDALPILGHPIGASGARVLTTLLYALKERKQVTGLATLCLGGGNAVALSVEIDRKSTRLNSSHLVISYAVFCLKKKNTNAAESKMLSSTA